MNVLADYRLMPGKYRDTLLRPGEGFVRLPAAERVRLASALCEMFERFEAAYRAEPRFEAPIRELIAWAALGDDIRGGLRIWRLQLHRARLALRQSQDPSVRSVPGAGRSPADKGHGWPASAPAGGPGSEILPSAKTPYMPTAVISATERA